MGQNVAPATPWWTYTPAGGLRRNRVGSAVGRDDATERVADCDTGCGRGVPRQVGPGFGVAIGRDRPVSSPCRRTIRERVAVHRLRFCVVAAAAPDHPPVSLIDAALGAGLRVGDELWRRHAACGGVDPALFAIERGQSPEPAFAYCRGCAVRAECLEHALELGQKAFGVWGNTTARTRREAKRRGMSVADVLAEVDRRGR
jgi:WhiB family transcriptional regulator, redox-sensing transcriptional regulator